ncbi:hypothetical protein [Roseateles asaccharophilus]|uniref:Uncharacterized protein n=1 Tax=Roseateles asaccharophilus TaxID=582607 RepID=A0ABU2A461_9BURK|nr:hypothetical protein [Roseateles asaccharophilus]MDR7331986.1 hypothetical protein [Roseateles asaccharophilus]
MATQTVPTAPLAGAEACRVMLASLAALQRVKVEPNPSVVDGQDDGNRYDYCGADRAIASALDSFGNNVGFRHALSHYLLSIMMDGIVPDPSALRADAMLTDNGYRPRGALPDAPGRADGALSLDDEQVGAGLSATWEIEALCESGRDMAARLGAMDDAAAMRTELKLRGLFVRIEQLSMALMSLLDEDIDTAHLQRKVFGRELAKEVAHA